MNLKFLFTLILLAFICGCGSTAQESDGMFTGDPIEFRGGAFGTLPNECECINETGQGGSCDSMTEAIRCLYTSSLVGLDLASLRIALNLILFSGGSDKEIGFSDSPVVVEAWGGVGGKGADDYFIFKLCTGGSGGERGYARTTLFYSDLDEQIIDDQLYIYVAREGPNSSNHGGRGAPSSIVIGQPLEDQSSSNSMFPDINRVIVAGAGSGAGSACGGGIGSSNGSRGGNGGCAIATRGGPSIKGMGEDGGGGNTGGGGGSSAPFPPGLGGSGGSDQVAWQGENGLGGFGGRNRNDNSWVGWKNSDLTHSDWGDGSGGLGKQSVGVFTAGGGGGGGFGGGGGGDFITGNNFSVGGGGGGGAWALRATADESSVPILGKNGIGGRAGAVALTFELVPVNLGVQAEAQALLESVGSAEGIGTGSGGRLNLEASYLLIDPEVQLSGLDLSQSSLTVLSVLNERGQELVDGFAGMEIPATVGSTAEEAKFESLTPNSPQISVSIEQDSIPGAEGVDHRVLHVDIEIDNADIAEPEFCGEEQVASLLTQLVLETDQGPLKLEVPEHWLCITLTDGSISGLTLGTEG